MTSEVDEKYKEESQAFKDKNGLVDTHECGKCSGRLVLVRVDDAWEAVCGTSRRHTSFRPIQTAEDAYRSGLPVPVYISNAIETRRPAVAKVETMAAIWQEKSRKLTPAGAYQAAIFSLQTGLDPRFNEVACIEFTTGGVKVPQLLITEIGWHRLAIRECPDQIDRPPVVQDVTDPEGKALAGAGPDDWVAKTMGTLIGDDPRLPLREATGIYFRADFDLDKDKKGPGGRMLPGPQNPQNQARVRATRHWYEKNVQQAVERARGGWQMAMEQVDTSQAELVIEGEFRVSEPSEQQSQGSSERRDDSRASKGGKATDNQIGYIKRLVGELFGWDLEDVAKEKKQRVEDMTVDEASKYIDELKAKQEANANTSDLFPGL